MCRYLYKKCECVFFVAGSGRCETVRRRAAPQGGFPGKRRGQPASMFIHFTSTTIVAFLFFFKSFVRNSTHTEVDNHC